MSVPAQAAPSPTGGAQSPAGFVTYEQLLNQDTGWALSEGSLFFEGRGRVQETLKRITARLEQLGIPYAVAGGLALLLHGYRRFTEDVDLLVTADGLRQIHRELNGHGYWRPFEGCKDLRDSESRVKIEFLVAGRYPGDRRPKCVVFPDPDVASEIRNGIRVLKLPELITLKIASGITAHGRTRDLADVGELIKSLRLPPTLADQLHPSVCEKYLEIRHNIYSAKRYIRIWPSPFGHLAGSTIDELIVCSAENIGQLKTMRDAGVTIDPRSKPASGHIYLVTNDPAVADRFGMHDESEFMDLDNTPPHS